MTLSPPPQGLCSRVRIMQGTVQCLVYSRQLSRAKYKHFQQMHLVEACSPSAAASFLGYGKEKTFFIKWEEKTLPQLKPTQNNFECKAFSGVLLCYPWAPAAVDPKSIQVLLSCIPFHKHDLWENSPTQRWFRADQQMDVVGEPAAVIQRGCRRNAVKTLLCTKHNHIPGRTESVGIWILDFAGARG